ncbi:hypothetical protein GGI04_004293, partial [Coemansia thaxteri]
ALMLYVLTPLGWHLDWWKSAQLPIVSTSVFDINGDIYNVTLVRRATVSGSQFQVAADVMDATMMYFNAYSPVRLAVNSALGYLFSVAAITAAAMHLFLWHPQWLGGAVRDMAQAFMRLWDPRRHFQTRSLKTQWPIGPVHSAQRNNSAAPVSGSDRQQPTNSSDCFAESTATTAIWSTEYALGRAARMLAFVLSLGVALLSSQLGISALPGWQSLLAVVWAAGMCLPIGFVEATTGFTLPMDVLPHVIAGWMQKPGSPIETSYFHLWATAPVRVALGWGGVRSFQLAHHCCQSPSTKQDIDLVNGDKRDVKRQHIHSIPWMNRGLLISLVWGACINHLVYVALSRSQVVPVRELPVLMSPQLPDRTPRIAMPTTPPLVGWQEEGEFGRLPAALSSELVVWGIVGPRSVFAADSPYRLLFAYGSVAGIVFPLLLFLLHVALAWLASATAVSTDLKFPGKYWRPCFSEALRRGAQVARGVQVPVILAGMVAVPAIPANFVVSGLAAAVGGQLWCRYRNRSLADRSLCSAAMDTGTKLAVVVLFVIGQAMVKRHGRLAFVEWWGNQPGNAERCMALQ